MAENEVKEEVAKPKAAPKTKKKELVLEDTVAAMEAKAGSIGEWGTKYLKKGQVHEAKDIVIAKDKDGVLSYRLILKGRK